MNEQQQIREATEKLAYKKWQAAGSPQGNGVNFWLEAEKEIMGRYPNASRRLATEMPGDEGEERTAAKKSVR
jgi:hypothetical protein